MQPREYQQDAINSIWGYFQSGKKGNPAVVLPTGTGKSIVIAGFIKSVLEQYPNQKIMAVTHVKELVEQNHEKLLTIWPNAPTGIYSAGLGRKEHRPNVIFGGIGSVAKKAKLFGHVDLILIDECHLVSPTQTTLYRKFIADLMVVNPNLKVIGLTATPYRVGQGTIIEEGSIFTDICYDKSTLDGFNWFIDEGFLATLIPCKTDLELSTEGVKKRGGEYVAKELQAAVDHTNITEAAVAEAIKKGGIVKVGWCFAPV